MRKILLLLLLSGSLSAQSLNYLSDWWTPNSGVTAHALDTARNRLYLAGGFSRFGPRDYVNGFELEANTGGLNNPDLPQPNGQVLAAVADGQGGWYVGGSFSRVGDSLRNSLVHIQANGQVGTLNAQFDGGVTHLTQHGSHLYIAGTFSTYRGRHTRGLVRIHTGTHELDTTWLPMPVGEVRTLLIANDTVFAAGSFHTIAGQSRSNLAALRAGDATALPWSAGSINGTVNAMVRFRDTLCIAGSFSHIGGINRSRLAGIAVHNATLTSLGETLGFNAVINCLALSNDSLYVGGGFISINGFLYKNLALVNLSSNSLNTTFNLDNNSSGFGGGTGVLSMLLRDTMLYVGGTFTVFQGADRPGLAAIHRSTNQVQAFRAMGAVGVTALAIQQNRLYVGAPILQVGGVSRRDFVAMDLQTGQATPLEINLPTGGYYIYAMLVHGSTLYVGGSFDSINGQARKNLAAIDLNTGQVKAWNPGQINNEVSALLVVDNQLLIGGRFTQVAGQSRLRLAAVDTLTGALSPWNPVVNNSYVSSIVQYNNQIYVGGGFTQAGGVTRNRLAAFSWPNANPSLLAWSPEANNSVEQLLLHQGKLYISGRFSTIASQSRSLFAAWDFAGDSLSSLSSGSLGGSFPLVRSTAIYDATHLILCGEYTNQATGKDGLSVLNLATGQTDALWHDQYHQMVVQYSFNNSSRFAVRHQNKLMVMGANNLLASFELGAPAAPTGMAAQAFCNQGLISDLQAQGSDIRWYSSASGGSPLAANTLLVHGNTYYASQTSGGLESTSRLAVSVTINQVAAPSGQASQSLCLGQNLDELSLSGSNLQWYTQASGGSPLTPGFSPAAGSHSYYASQTLNACESAQRFALSLNVVELSLGTPSLTLASSSSASDGQISLSPSGGASPYSFLWSSGGTDNPLQNLSPGTYEVTVTEAGGCSATASYSLGFNPPMNLQNLPAPNVRLFPNPSRENRVFFQFQGQAEMLNLELFDVLGRQHWQRELPAQGLHELPLPELPGTYFLRLQTAEGQVHTWKLIRSLD